MKTSIIVPCYNEQDNIKALVKHFCKISKKYRIELILVNNGSEDATKSMIQKYEKIYPFVKLVHVEVNQGYGYGILQGLQKASGEYLGWIHADLQSNPDVFCKMIHAAKQEQAEFLFKGIRTNRPFVDTLFTFGMSIYESIYLKQMLWDINAQPVMFSRSFFESWKDAPYDFSLDLYIYYMAKKRKIKIRRFVSRQYQRMNGISSWNTGMSARWKLIQRVFSYSWKLKYNICP